MTVRKFLEDYRDQLIQSLSKETAPDAAAYYKEELRKTEKALQLLDIRRWSFQET